MISRPSPEIDAWRDEMLHNLLDGRAAYKVDDLPDQQKARGPRRRAISLGTCAPNA